MYIEKGIKNLARDLVMNQSMATEGYKIPAEYNIPKNFGFLNGLREEEYFQLLQQKFGQ